MDIFRGFEAKEFEKTFSKFISHKYGVSFNGTAALELQLKH